MLPRSIAVLSAFLILAACNSGGTVAVDDSEGEVIGSQEVQQILPGKEVTHPEHGKQVGFSYGAVSGAEGSIANGVMYKHEFEDGVTVAIMTVNIKKAPAAKVYVGWLVKEDRSAPVKMGPLGNPFGDTRHAVELTAKEALKDHQRLLVTLEASANVTAPGQVVADGTLRMVK